MLVLRRYVENLDLLPFYQLPQKMVPYVYVLRIGIGDRMLCDLNPLLSSNKGMHGIPALGNMKRQTCLKNKISFATSDIATYSACVVDSVTHF